MNRSVARARRSDVSLLKSCGGLVWLGAVLAVVGTSGCQGGGGDFVGLERPDESGKTCNLCTPAIVPTPVNCAREEEGLEFLPMKLWDFSSGTARNTYAYVDNTAGSWNLSDSWQPDTEETVRCEGAGNTNAFHFKGGPFLNWGGGIGRHLKCLNGSPDHLTGEVKIGSDLGTIARACDASQPLHACAEYPDGSTGEVATLTEKELDALYSVCPDRDKAAIEADSIAAARPEEEFLLGMTLDLSEWDGISFWARRSSNDAAAGIRLSLGDKHTDDDLSYLQQHINPDDIRYCERNVECGCPDFSECYPNANSEGQSLCLDMRPMVNGEGVEFFAVCGDFVCEDVYQPMQHPDELTAGTSCTVFHNRGGLEEYYCYDPDGNRPPVERTDLCGDHWVHPIRLSTEWQFYKVPFGSLLQEGWAKEQFEFDLTSAAVLRFTWGTGWQDFWIDDVRAYRNVHNTTGDGE